MNAICAVCDTEFRHVDRNEDGAPEIPDMRKCAAPDCETWLCPAACLDHFSFVCAGCGQRFCQAHAVFVLAGDKFCAGCYTEVWPEIPVLRPVSAKTVQFASPEFRHLNEVA